ncbi:MAG: TadA family conjugal transfer-associated ATPase [Actinomycetes bacterium]
MTPGTAWLPPWLQGPWEVPGVTDVLVNGPGEVWIDRGRGLERWEAARDVTEAQVREAAVRLASLAGRRLDDASPVTDARLPDGSRLHAVLPPVAERGTAISLRAVRSRAFTLEDLALTGMIASSDAPALEGLVRERASVLITGATGSGKTTLLASLLSLVDARERIVVIEEAGELAPDHPHVVRLVERRANVDGAGSVGLDRLVKEALRMRPDRIVLGECRGPEVREVLLALNTGHRGGFATLHANGLEEVPARLLGLAALAGLSAEAAAMHAAAAFDVVLHVERSGGVRRLTGWGALVLDDAGLRAEPLARDRPGGRAEAA